MDCVGGEDDRLLAPYIGDSLIAFNSYTGTDNMAYRFLQDLTAFGMFATR